MMNNENNQPPQFLKNVPHEYILLPNIKGKDKICGIGKKWTLEECEYKMTKDQYISCCYYLKYTNYAVVDIDDPNYTLEQFYEDTKMEKGFYTKGNTKGFHIWMELPQDKEETLKKNVVKCSHLAEIDYLGEKVFERVGKEWFKDKYDEPSYFDQESFKKCFQMDKLQQKKTTTNTQAPTADVGLLQSIVNIIAIPYLDDRDAWIKIMCAMKKCGFTEEQARQTSMKSERFTEDGFIAMWNSYSIENITASEGTLRYYAKLSNNDLYYKTTAKPFSTEPTDRDFSELFWELAGDCCIVSNSTMYLYYRNQWRIIDKKEPHILRTMIGDTIREHFEKQLGGKDDMKQYAITLNHLKEICKKNKLSNVCSFVMDKMYSEHCDTEDIFDNKPYIFAFKNKAFDLKTGLPYDIKKEDYITQNTGRDYVKPTDDQLEVVAKVFNSIFPDPEVGKCYLSVLRLSLSGEHPEKLFIANGQGRNGKGLLNELAFKMLGDYAYKLSIEVLTKEVKKTGANPELANLHKKRMVVSSEPEDGCKIQTGFVKELTGCAEISARGLYNGNTKTQLNMVLIMELNKKLLLSGRMDTSVLERIVDIPFESTFVSNPDDVDESNGIYKGNLDYKTEAWQEEHSCAFFQYILENAEKTLYVPERIRNLSKQYVLGSDEMYGWVMENYEATDNTEFVKLKDVFDLYKASDLYSNLTKLEKRNLNKKAFSDLISNHIVLKKQFRTGQAKINGKKIDCERIHGLKLIEHECDSDDEDLGGDC
jgi:phage/plasmid-associated DNA primase